VLRVALVLLAGCGDALGDGASPGADAGPAGRSDGGAGVVPWQGKGYFPFGRSLMIEAGEFSTDAADPGAYDPRTCWDESDGDGDGSTDCQDDGCAGVRSCAIGDGDRCELLATTVADVAACEGAADPTGCLSAARAIGASAIEASVLVPLGTMSGDAGFVFGDPIDLSSERARIAVSFVRSDCDGCVEGAAVAVARAEVQRIVEPVVALVASSARGNVALVVGDAMVATWPIDAETPTPFELVLRPTGEVTARRTDIGDPGTTIRITPMRDLEVVAYGRNPAHAAPTDTRAGIAALSIARSICDMPSSWVVGPARPVRQGSAAMVDFSSPSTWTEGAVEAIAVTRGMAIYAGEYATDAFAIGETPAVRQHPSHATAGVTDPEIFFHEGAWNIAFTAVASDGVKSIGLARGGASIDAEFAPEAGPVIHPSAIGVRDLEMPTVAFIESGEWLLVARATRLDGSRALLGFTSDDRGQQWDLRVDADLGDRTARPGAVEPLAFDADEIADPSLVIVNGGYQLYFAGRRGTRWGIGLYASDEFLFWRPMNGGSLMAPSVGTRRPDVSAIGGELRLISENSRSHAVDVAVRAIPSRPR
jgi:hypothetical protein